MIKRWVETNWNAFVRDVKNEWEIPLTGTINVSIDDAGNMYVTKNVIEDVDHLRLPLPPKVQFKSKFLKDSVYIADILWQYRIVN